MYFNCRLLFILTGYALLLGCHVDPVDYDLYTSNPSAQSILHISVSAGHKLESRLADFASTHKYQLHIARVNSGEPQFSITMWRPDSLIVGSNPFEITSYKFSVYPAHNGAASIATMNQILDELNSKISD